MSDSDWDDPEDAGSGDEAGWGVSCAASNVVMLTGPVGCGKTAAAYAVAVVGPCCRLTLSSCILRCVVNCSLSGTHAGALKLWARLRGAPGSL